MPAVEPIAATVFALALLHAFSTGAFVRLAHRHPRHAGVLHLLGEIEIVFGLWALVLLGALALVQGIDAAIAYAETRRYTEPLFVFVVMVVAGSRPVLQAVTALVMAAAGRLPLTPVLAEVWLCLTLLPLLGSLVTEPAAMTLAALLLAPRVFRSQLPERLKYGALGVLFVNVSIGGTFTSFAAPPVLMVAAAWQWDSVFMATTFGWKAGLAVVVNASVLTWLMRRHLPAANGAASDREAGAPIHGSVPWHVSFLHLALLAAVIAAAHHPVLFIAVFLLFLAGTAAYPRHHGRLILKEALMVAVFLAGLVVLGGLQQWWLQPIVTALDPLALFFGALGLTAVTDNAAITYLGSLIDGISADAQYMLVAGAVAGGGLTVIANAPNPAGAALLKSGFAGGSIGAGGLLAGALLPTAVAAAAFLLL